MTNFDINKPFSKFIRRIEDTMDMEETVQCPCKTAQITLKAFNLITNAQVLPESGTRE